MTHDNEQYSGEEKPLIPQEYPLSDNDILMSTTDTSSYVTYANEAFLRVSGYPREELLGQPHNIVRHPDMPKAAFADMWSTLKNGDAWTALVKNRRANGEYYWVRANVTPVQRDGQITGYMSVRTCPTRDEVKQAAALYKRFSAGTARGLAFHKGLIVRTGLLAFTRLKQIMPVRWRIRLSLGGVALGTTLATMAATGISPQLLATFLPVAITALLADIWLERGVASPLTKVLEQAKAVSIGRPGAKINMNRVDEIGMIMRAVNQAELNLRSLVEDVSTQTHNLYKSSEQVATSNQDLSGRASETQARLQETAAAAEQITATVQHSADHTQSAHQLTVSTHQAAEQGRNVVARLVQSMAEIAVSSNKIAEINNLIDSIAFQTNILALNAAVEAARAGEVGRGFAVVASEVRNLAQRSASAAHDIKALIDESVDKSSEGSKQAAEAGDAIENVVNEVHRVSALISEISISAKEQSTGVSQISQAVTQLDRIAQQNADQVKESSDSAQDLFAHTTLLNKTVQVFELHDH